MLLQCSLLLTSFDSLHFMIMLTYLGEELLQLFVKNEQGGKVLICDEGKCVREGVRE